MLDQNKATLEKANAAVKAGDNEGFLSYCVEDLVWTTVGQGSLRGKPAVREWIRDNYVKPPRFTVDEMIAQGDLVAALGTIEIEVDGAPVAHAYCDVWRFRQGKMAELRAFVVPKNAEAD
jgi:ketosteroid isomerase-like protein